jgi:hypothetical protein
MWPYLIATIVVLSPLTWVRTLETFKIGFIFAICCIAFLLIVCVTIIFIELDHNHWQAGEGYKAFNYQGFITMWGLSFYMYEGIGCVLPVMDASDYKDNFATLLTIALITLFTIHTSFSELAYYYFGDSLVEPLVQEQIPMTNTGYKVTMIIAKLLFVVNIIFSFPLLIYVTNQIVESYVFCKMKYSTLRTWLKNLSRTVIVTIAALVAYFFYYQLHKIFSFFGVVIGSFVVLITPALIHYREVSETKSSRVINVLIIIYASIMALVLGTLIIYNWNGKLTGSSSSKH